jgi:hypothetical protein
MKTVKDIPATHKRGRRVTVELAPGETLVAVKEGGYYSLGGQVEDIVHSNVITDMKGVYWCSITQGWEAK